MRSRWITHSLAVIGVTVVLTSCEGIKKQIGLAKDAPDEFTVVTKAPLIIPPDFTLRPPRPGAAGPQEIQVQEQARRALLRSGRVKSDTSTITSNAAPPSRSRAETAFLRNAGADKADPEIRTVIRRETLALAEKDSSFTRRLMFWRGDREDESLIDAEKEAERLREAAAKGESPAEGEVPVIERTGQSILKRIF
tara:strand:- start:1604 stop:2188 length:585 start_codon:yes stop_codon:yes gene_type:complete